MIPEFPEFKQLTLSDKADVEALTHNYPPYSDFEFASLYAWNVQEKTELSWHHGNLIVRFTDYVDGKFFYTCIGENDVNDTAEKLLALSSREGLEPVLKLIPEVTARHLDTSRFSIIEDRDNFDYVFETKRYLTFSGARLKSRRNFLNGFLKQYPDYQSTTLDLTDTAHLEQILTLQNKWSQDSANFSTNEARAFMRFLTSAEHFQYLAVAILIDDMLVGLSINALPPETPESCAHSLFLKADKEYRGIYAAMMHETSKQLIEHGYRHINYEQDLGIEGLRKAKIALDPAHFLNKYTITHIS
jgi:hypothetical protein